MSRSPWIQYFEFGHPWFTASIRRDERGEANRLYLANNEILKVWNLSSSFFTTVADPNILERDKLISSLFWSRASLLLLHPGLHEQRYAERSVSEKESQTWCFSCEVREPKFIGSVATHLYLATKSCNRIISETLIIKFFSILLFKRKVKNHNKKQKRYLSTIIKLRNGL